MQAVYAFKLVKVKAIFIMEKMKESQRLSQVVWKTVARRNVIRSEFLPKFESHFCWGLLEGEAKRFKEEEKNERKKKVEKTKE